MHIAFTTVVRRVPHHQAGEIVLLDWETKRVVQRRAMTPTQPNLLDENPRGGARGGRGVLRGEGFIVAATYHTLHFFDDELRETDRLTHDLFVGLHELCWANAERTHLWAAATAVDRALLVNLPERRIERIVRPRAIESLQQQFDLRPLDLDESVDNRTLWVDTKHNDDPSHTHLNAVLATGGGALLLLNRFGAVFDVDADTLTVHDPAIAGAHNLRLWRDQFIINDTRNRAVRFYDRTGGRLVRSIDLLSFRAIEEIHARAEKDDPKARSIFVRGLELFDGGRRALVGFSPAAIAEIDLESGDLLDVFQYSTRVRACVHGIAVISA